MAPRPVARRVVLLGVAGSAALALGHRLTLHTPGARGGPTLPDSAVLALAGELRDDVEGIAALGPRSSAQEQAAAAGWVAARLARRHEVRWHAFRHGRETFWNLEVRIPGVACGEEIVIAGAHHDSVRGSPGANDNGSGVAVLLALARRLEPQPRTVRLVAFATEEPPYFRSEGMGSLAYARAARAHHDDVVAMVSLDSLGYFSDEPGSQRYPAGLGAHFPDRGDFLAFVSDLGSGPEMRRAIGAFRGATPLPAEGAALPSSIPGVAFSDHASFWRVGYPAFLVTDTAPFRDPAYHTQGDLPDRLDYRRLALAAVGLEAVIAELARCGT